MIARDAILGMSNRALAEVLRGGFAIDPAALDDSGYRGISLGLPAFVERMSWKTFRKVFHRDRDLGALRGWNVRVEQNGLDASSTPLVKDGAPVCFGHYLVVEGEGARFGAPNGLVLDYRRGGNAALDPVSRLVDPLVALERGSVTMLLGRSYFDAGLGCVPTPSFFLLEREGPLERVVPSPLRG